MSISTFKSRRPHMMSYLMELTKADYISLILMETPVNAVMHPVPKGYYTPEHQYLLVLLHKLNVRPPL